MIVKGYIGRLSAEDSQLFASQGIYVFNSLCIGCREHIEWAYLKMNEVFENKKNIARKKHLEMMLILSGKRQISEAISLCGSEEANSIVAISENDFDIPLRSDDNVINFRPEKMKHLGIEAFEFPGKGCDLFFENSAMLELER